MDRRIDLDRARREAKALLCAARAGDAESLARMRAEREPRLADAQRAVANDLGEPSWPGLARRVEAEARADVDELLHAVFAGEHRAARAGPDACDGALLRALGFSLVRDLPDRVFDLLPPDRLGAPRRRR